MFPIKKTMVVYEIFIGDKAEFAAMSERLDAMRKLLIAKASITRDIEKIGG